MKRKLWIGVISILSVLICAFGLFACAERGDEEQQNDTHTHRYVSYVYNNDATCGVDGTETAKCEYCDKTDTRTKSGTATGEHIFGDDNICDVCGHEKSGGQEKPESTYKTVTFDLNGGDGSISPMQFAVGKVMSDLPVPCRDGYRFICWEEPWGDEYTSASIMPDSDLTLRAKWEKIITTYEDKYVFLKPASSGYKSSNIYASFAGEVDTFVYVEITSDDLGGASKVGTPNNFTLRTMQGMEYKMQPGYTWQWYQGDFDTPNGAQRFTLNYGSNVQLITVSDNSGVVVRTYCLDIYVRHDYSVRLYKNIFEREPYKTVRVIENERFDSNTEVSQSVKFEFDNRVYYNEQTETYEPFVYSTAINKNLNLYQTYKPYALEAELNGGKLNGELAIKPYTQYFTLPSPMKDGYDFLGWQDPSGKYVTSVQGYAGEKYISESYCPEKLTAVFAKKKGCYTFVDNILKTYPAVPVVTYTDKKMTDILDIVYTPYGEDCVLPTLTPNDSGSVFKEWQQFYYSEQNGFNKHSSPFDFNVKITKPIALVPETETVTEQSIAIPLNMEKQIVARGKYAIYLPLGKAYTLNVQTSGSVDFAVTLSENGTQKTYNYSATSSAPKTVTLRNYIYNLGSQQLIFGYVYLDITSISNGCTIKVSGATAETDGAPVIKKGENTVDIGEELSFVCKLGYSFGGWFDGEDKVSEDVAINMPVESKLYTAKWLLDPALSNFVFTSTETTCEISGVVDKTISEIVVPDYVTTIIGGAFGGCSSLTSITLPFIGRVASNADDKIQYPFGYIFGTDNYLGSVSVKQTYVNKSYGDGVASSTYYIPESLKNVTTAGENIPLFAFRGCRGLTSITLLDSITTVGGGIFYYCDNLVTVTLPKKITALPSYYGMKGSNRDYYGFFENCTSLSDITIPNSVTSIGNYAFWNCKSLTSIMIPNSVTSIGNYAFRDCSSLTIYCEAVSELSGWNDGWNYSNCPVVLDCKNNEVVADGYIYAVIDGVRYSLKDEKAIVVKQSKNIGGNVVIPSSTTYKGKRYSVTSVGNSAFEGCSGLTSLIFAENNQLTSIGANAFDGCSGLTSITIPDSVTSIGSYAFRDCNSLTSLTFAENSQLTSIGARAFYYCSGLTSITIPDSVMSIESSAFRYNSGLTIYCEAVSQPSGWNDRWNYGDGGHPDCPVVWDCKNNEIADDGYKYAVIDGVRYSLKDGKATVVKQPKNIGNVVILSSVTYKGNEYSVKIIEDSAFAGYSGLTSVMFAESSQLTSIGANAFEGCSGLTSVTIPKSVTSIGSYAFRDCNSLTIYCEIAVKPNNWADNWNSLRPVVWNCKYTDIADDGYKYAVIDGVRYSLKDGKATVVAQPRTISGNVVIPLSVTYKGSEYSVTSIGNYAFQCCGSLTSIIISDRVTRIGSYVFSDCEGLTLYCEAASKPSGWNDSWNSSNCPVVWGYKPN